jgi:light-harvesting complex 1 beta chain
MECATGAFYGIFVVSFVVFLAIALMAQVLGLPWRTWLPGAESVKSIIGGVKAAVYTVVMPNLI